jgi:intracellular sulfur oxidation DsrE/DsrF family protein
MSETEKYSWLARRMFLARLGIGAGIVGAGVVRPVETLAQGTTETPWRPARHAQDDWFEKIPGVHRFLFDTSTAEGMASALQFANNYYRVNHDDYGLNDADLAVIIVARHKSTSFAYNDSIWAKYGKQLSEQAEFVDPKTKEPPTSNLYAVPGDATALPGRMDLLIKRGAQFAVCGASTRGIAGRIAQATGQKTDAIVKEITANLIPNSRMIPAGIVAVNRAQERGYTFVYAA